MSNSRQLPVYEAKITSGNLLSITTMLVSVAFFWGVLDSRGQRNEENIAALRADVIRIETAGSARVEGLAAAINGRIDSLEGRLRAVELFTSEARAELRAVQSGIEDMRGDVRRVLDEHERVRVSQERRGIGAVSNGGGASGQ